MSDNWNDIEVNKEGGVKQIRTYEVHPGNLNTFACYDEVSKKIENLLILWANDGEREIKISVLSGKGRKDETVYQCLPKSDKVTSINDFDFKFISL